MCSFPAEGGDPSLIKHVFVIICENRTYDQVVGDVGGGNGEPAMAVSGDAAPKIRIVRLIQLYVFRFRLRCEVLIHFSFPRLLYEPRKT